MTLNGEERIPNEVIDMRIDDEGHCSYLVKWMGEKEDTWEGTGEPSILADRPDLIALYRYKQRSKGKGKTSASSDATQSESLTREEAQIYDRQIRLWGVEAQQRLRKAKILVAGAGGLGNEVIKNILLSGIKHMTILDSQKLSHENASAQFLSPEASVDEYRSKTCMSRAKDLNPMVDIVADTQQLHEKSEEFFQGFDVVCLTGENKENQIRVNEICRRLGVKFFSGNVYGYYGYMFADLGKHEFVEEKVKVATATESTSEPAAKKPRTTSNSNTDEVEMIERDLQFVSFADALAYDYVQGKTARQLKQLSKAYLVSRIMMARNGKSDSNIIKDVASHEELLELRNTELERIGLDSDMLPDEFASLCRGELFPVNAIVGGVLSQEIIKAVSHKDRPHDNFFFYDGNLTTGLVHRMAPSEKVKGTPSEQKEAVAMCVEEIL